MKRNLSGDATSAAQREKVTARLLSQFRELQSIEMDESFLRIDVPAFWLGYIEGALATLLGDSPALAKDFSFRQAATGLGQLQKIAGLKEKPDVTPAGPQTLKDPVNDPEVQS